jgi:N-acetyl-anhydromuramyl-L-alanine amidase AmpD
MMNGTRREFLSAGVLGLLGFGLRPAWGSASCGPAADLKQLAERVDFMRRSEWTADQPRRNRLRVAATFSRITVHHAGAANCHNDRTTVVYDLQGVLSAHSKRNYGDVGYHFIIDYTGRVWEGRSLQYEGAHVLGENERNIGVMLLGNFEIQEPSADQSAALAELCGFLMEQYDIRKQHVYGHRDLGHSLCPGRHLYPHVVDLRS